MAPLVEKPRILIRKDPFPHFGQWHVLCQFCPPGKQARCWCPGDKELNCYATFEIARGVAAAHWRGTHAREVRT